MFGIGIPEMILIMAIALIVIGPKKIPDLARTLGRAMREFRKATSEFKDTLQLDDDLSEVKRAFNDISTDIKDAVDPSVKPAKRSPAMPANEDEPPAQEQQDPEQNDKVQVLDNAYDEWKSRKEKPAEDDMQDVDLNPDATAAQDSQEKKPEGSVNNDG